MCERYAEIVEQLRSYDPRVRMSALDALRTLRGHDVLEAASQMLNDQESIVRCLAVDVVAELRGELRCSPLSRPEMAWNKRVFRSCGGWNGRSP